MVAPEWFFPQPQRDPGKSQLLHRDALPLLWEQLRTEEFSHGPYSQMAVEGSRPALYGAGQHF